MGAWLNVTTQQRQVAIAGRVLDAVTKRPIAGAEIKIVQSPPQFQAALKLKALNSKGCDRVTSTIEGWFYFVDLPDGSYTLSVSLPSMGTRYGSITTQPITVSRASEPFKTVIVEDILLPTTAIAGTITYQDKPVKMARIQVEGVADSTLSDAEGKYLITGLTESPSVRSIVTVFARGHPPAPAEVQLQQGITTLDFELPPLPQSGVRL